MAPNKPKKPRGSRGARSFMMDGNPSSIAACDMMVMLPKDVSKLQSQLHVKEIMNRLAKTGYTHMALTHTIYGRPRPVEDRADVAIPKSLYMQPSNSKGKAGDQEPSNKKQKTSNERSGAGPPIRVLRRLHAVLENISDVGIYLSNGPQAELLNEYDLVSVSPRNDATFQSACNSATVADIITLDYTIRGLKLPFKIRPTEVKAVIARQAAFEIPFAPALLNSKQRKAIVQTSRELQTSCLGVKPCLIFSSGDRTFEESDVGAMALRMPGDLSNLLQTVLHFDPSTAQKAVGASGLAVLKRAEERRWGKSDVADVAIGRLGHEAHHTKNEEKVQSSPLEPAEAEQEGQSDEEDIEDGYIAM